MFSLFSSRSIIADLRELSIVCRSSVIPVHIVRTFQLAIRRAGVFFAFVLSGAQFDDLLVEHD